MFTHKSSEQNVTLLDLEVKPLNDQLITDLHVKPTYRHQYLHFTSLHPDHTKRFIIFTQTLRLSKICTFENDLIRHGNEMKLWFLRRGCPKKLIETEVKKVSFSTSSNETRNKVKGFPMTIRYHPLLKTISSIICKNLYLLHMNDEIKKTFTLYLWFQFLFQGNLVAIWSGLKFTQWIVV